VSDRSDFSGGLIGEVNPGLADPIENATPFDIALHFRAIC
jgi:hypothetical protein